MSFPKILLAPLSLLVLLMQSLVLAQTPSTAPTMPEADHFNVDAIDGTVDPCTNFYEYSCKKWIAANPIPSDQASWGHGAKLNLWNQFVLRDVLEKASANAAGRSAVDQKIGDYYASCMDETALSLIHI